MKANASTLFIIFWWKSLPLGQYFTRRPPLFLSKPAIREIAEKVTLPATEEYLTLLPIHDSGRQDSVTFRDRLALLDKIVDDNAQSAGFSDVNISLVIPTCGRVESLRKNLSSLAMLEIQPNEIIVVDNAPSSNPFSSAGIQDLQEEFPNVRFIREVTPGASAARNRGAYESSGEIIAFLDDDELVHPSWLTQLCAGFRDPRVGVVTGIVFPTLLTTYAQGLFEERFSFIKGYHCRDFGQHFFEANRWWGMPVWEIGGSGNMAIRRELFNTIDGFDERLGSGRAGCSEDTELFYRVIRSGWTCRYEPRAICYHNHRFEMAGLKQQLFGYMRGHITALLIQFAKWRDVGNLFRLFLWLPLVYLKYFMRGLMLHSAFAPEILMTEVAGCLSGVKFYWQNRERPKKAIRNVLLDHS